ncbi:MAG: hypothetical protein ABJH45_06230 [Paracoccaceae bacterium]
MLRPILILLLAFWGTTVHADEKDDAAFFMAHFFELDFWDIEGRSFPKVYYWYYKDLLSSRSIEVVDRDRFSSMFPQSAADDRNEQYRQHASDAIIEFYGPENLGQIVDFFQTPTGQKMLRKAKADNLFRRARYQTSKNGPIEKMKAYVAFSELSRYSEFASSPAGRFFVRETYFLRRKLFHDKMEYSRWYTPPLNRPYIVDILKADGVLKFPNRIARDALIREIRAASP